jgi:hypothetical protein
MMVYSKTFYFTSADSQWAAFKSMHNMGEENDEITGTEK